MNLKRIVDTLPLLGVFLIFNGFLKLFYYYNEWNINIIEYLEISEIVLSFLNDVNLMIFWLIIFLVQQIIASKLIDFADHKLATNMVGAQDAVGVEPYPNEMSKILDNKRPLSSLVEYIYHKKSLLFFSILVLFTSVCIHQFFHTNKLFWLYFAVFSVFKLLTAALDYLVSLKLQIIISISAIITMLMFTYGIAIYDIKKRKTSALFTETTVELNNRIITTSSTLILVGKTQKFIFFYDSVKRRSIVIPLDEVVMINTKGTY
ncbi:MAG: hypothetical protein ACK4WD_03135 [Flavobacteriales bacterium]|jgi:hypothetical protein